MYLLATLVRPQLRRAAFRRFGDVAFSQGKRILGTAAALGFSLGLALAHVSSRAQEPGPGLDSHVLALAVTSDGKLYAGGKFRHADGLGVDGVAMWDGSQWSDLAGGVRSGARMPGTVAALAADGTSVYVGGAFNTVGPSGAAPVSAWNVARWDGTQWYSVGAPESLHSWSYCRGLAWFDGKLFAAVANTYPSSQSGVWVWNGSTWADTGVSGTSPPALVVAGGHLYALRKGQSYSDQVLRWSGTAWQTFWDIYDTTYSTYGNNALYSLVDSGSVLVIGGDFSGVDWRHKGESGSTSIPAKAAITWDETEFAEFGGGLWGGTGAGNAYRMVATGSAVVVGGYFDRAGTVTAANIARWDGTQWQALGTGVRREVGDGPLSRPYVRALATAGSMLYAAGTFDRAGGIGVGYIARWDGSAWSALVPAGPSPVFRVDGLGNVSAHGAFHPGGADFAEWFAVAPGSDVECGDVLALGADGKVIRAGTERNTGFAGVYATAPGLLGSGTGGQADGQRGAGCIPLAATGIVPVKVTDENGPIRPGDPLSLSNRAGFATRATPVTLGGQSFIPEEAIIGKALDGLDQGSGTIRVLLR